MHKLPDLATALAYSRYATGMLAARPDERARLEATIDAPFAWDAALAEIDACVGLGEGRCRQANVSELRTPREIAGERVQEHAQAQRTQRGRERLGLAASDAGVDLR